MDTDARTAGRRIRVEDLVGAWRLREYVTRDVTGRVEHPLGEAPVGLLLYTADGHHAGHMTRATRQPFAEPRTEAVDRAKGTDTEVRRAFDEYFGYAGTYQVDPDGSVVRHAIALCLIPGWEGRTTVREAALDEAGTTLVLTTPPRVVGGVEQRARLTWVRP